MCRYVLFIPCQKAVYKKMNPNINQFKSFIQALMKQVPEGYEPWLFPVARHGKNPEARIIYARAPIKSCCNVTWIKNKQGKICCEKCGEKKGSWKAPWARLTPQEAIKLMLQGYNIGIAGRTYDPLTIIDIDNSKFIHLLKDTLIVKSRSRLGSHGFYWNNPGKKKIPNIPTEDYGEVRSQDMYVLAAGSYVPTTEEELSKKVTEGEITEQKKEDILKDTNLGYYTVEAQKEPSYITYEQLPQIFLDVAQKPKEEKKAELKHKTVFASGKHSALFDLTIKNLTSVKDGDRIGHPLHASDTSANFSIDSSNPDLCHCWRHSVSLNALQFLVVESGYMGCSSAGTGHKNSGAGSSQVTNNDGAIFHAWLQAKKDKIISDDDAIPVRAMCYIAKKHKLCSEDLIPKREESKLLPVKVYNEVLRIVEEGY